jgi:hypothetical protein
MTGRGIVRTGLRATILAAIFVVAALLSAARPAYAQLVSPGKLTAAHAELDGMGSCTKCHDLGKQGASNAKCLACHETVKDRVDKKAGLHATYGNRPCASCHKEHFGAEFVLVRFDTAGFNHTRVGFELKGAHRDASCRKCHKPALVANAAVRTYGTAHKTLARTYLGLATGCLDCHRTDNAHANQFGARACTECHTEESWKKAPLFNHDLARYVLTGKHRTADCEKCHKPMRVAGADKPVTRYAGVQAARCTSCHVDKHQGRMKQSCETCHSTENWARLLDRNKFEASFDHNARTKFALSGAHAKAACARCHTPTAKPAGTVRLVFPTGQAQTMYPAPRATDCLACHIDVHETTFADAAGGPLCVNCHTDNSWLPTSYDLVRHNRETYVLTGAHVAVPCSACHPPIRPGGPPKFRLPSRECVACHQARDPHGGQFAGRVCSECHITDSFRIAAFDHSKTQYPLDGAHAKVACIKCHIVTTPPGGAPFTRYRPLETTCRSCHGTELPRRP